MIHLGAARSRLHDTETSSVVVSLVPEAVVNPCLAGFLVELLAGVRCVGGDWVAGIVNANGSGPGAVGMFDTESATGDITASYLVVVALVVRFVERTGEAKVSLEFRNFLASVLRKDGAAGGGSVKASELWSKPPASLTGGRVLECSAFLSVRVAAGLVHGISANAVIVVKFAARAAS